MNILKDFDAAISATETLPKGYCIDGRIYDSYISNAAWEEYLRGISTEHRGQFGGGSGGELVAKNGRPPKMASFASSSRMAYLLSRDIEGFEFEKQLSTVIGGVANLDGYREYNGEYTFVEAKCREPYSHKSPQTIKQNYKPLYTYLCEKMPDIFSCRMEVIPDSANMRVSFFCREKEVIAFDIKQMLCHLLAVANKMLSENICDAPIRFLYLLYNPTGLALPSDAREKILEIHEDVCTSAKDFDFVRIFAHIVDFLMQNNQYAVTKDASDTLKKNFSFVLCNQNDYKIFFNN